MRCRQRTEIITHNRPLITESDEAALIKTLNSGTIANGSTRKNFESDFCKVAGGGFACAVSSGTAALFLAINSLNLKKRSNIAVPTYACHALLDAIYWNGHNAIPIDVEEDYNLSIKALSSSLSENNIHAIIVVHTFGRIAKINAISECFAGPIIEDCCHSLGANINGFISNHMTTASIYSFYATKIITCGEGGLLWSANSDLIQQAHKYLNPKALEEYEPRFNLRISDIQASIAHNQLLRLNDITLKRQEIARLYFESLPKRLKSKVQTELTNESQVYRFVIRFDNVQERNNAHKKLNEIGIKADRLILPGQLLHRQLNLSNTNFQISEQLVQRTLSIPLYPALSEDSIQKIASELSRL